MGTRFTTSSISFLGIVLICLEGLHLVRSTCLLLHYNDTFDIFENVICLNEAAATVIPPSSKISYVSRDMDSATYINMARSLHSKESMAYIMSVRYASLVEAYTAGMWYCFHRAANTSCATTEADVDQCFDQCSKLLTITRTVLFQLRRMILGLGCEHTNSEQCSPFALHYNCTPKYEVTSVNELAGKIVNATTEIYYGIVGYNKFRIDALNNSPTGALSPSDFVSTIKFRRFCVPDGQPIVLPQCV